jgi:hypothetical protein
VVLGELLEPPHCCVEGANQWVDGCLVQRDAFVSDGVWVRRGLLENVGFLASGSSFSSFLRLSSERRQCA